MPLRTYHLFLTLPLSMTSFVSQRRFAQPVSRFVYSTSDGVVVSQEQDPCDYPSSDGFVGAQYGKLLLEYSHFPVKMWFDTNRTLQYQLRPQWGRDDYFYMSFLPRSLDCPGDTVFDPLDWRKPFTPELLRRWLELEEMLSQIANVLIGISPLFPLHVKPPPRPSVLQYASYFDDIRNGHKSRAESRRWTAQKLMFAWGSWIACQISLLSDPSDGRPRWLRALHHSQIPNSWVDRASKSSFLCALQKRERCGMIINMSVDWSFLMLCDRLERAVPIWFLYPDRTILNPPSDFARSIAPPPPIIHNIPRHPFDFWKPPPPYVPSALELIAQRQASQSLTSHRRRSQSPDPPSRSTTHPLPPRPSSPLPPKPSPPALPRRPPPLAPRTSSSLIARQSSPYPDDPNDDYLMDDQGAFFPVGSAQRPDETIAAFFVRREQEDLRRLEKETSRERQKREKREREVNDQSGAPPNWKFFEWTKAECPPYHFRQPRDLWWANQNWDDYTAHQKRINHIRQEIDFCEDFAPDELPDDFSAGPTHAFMDVPSVEDNILPNVHLPGVTVLHPDQRELDKSFMTLDNMQYLTVAIRSRYGATLAPPTGPAPMELTAALKYLNERQHGLLSQLEADAISHFVSAVLAVDHFRSLPPELSQMDYILDTNPNKLTVYGDVSGPSLRNVTAPLDAQRLGFYILTRDAPSLYQVLSSSSTTFSPLAEHLVRLGCSFSVLSSHVDEQPCHPRTPALTHSFRPRHHAFVKSDYESYVLTRCTLLRQPALAIAAFTSGGILWRLTTESVQQGNVFDGKPADFATHHSVEVGSSFGLQPMVHYQLSPSEIDIIVGTYTDYNGVYFFLNAAHVSPSHPLMLHRGSQATHDLQLVAHTSNMEPVRHEHWLLDSCL